MVTAQSRVVIPATVSASFDRDDVAAGSNFSHGIAHEEGLFIRDVKISGSMDQKVGGHILVDVSDWRGVSDDLG